MELISDAVRDVVDIPSLVVSALRKVASETQELLKSFIRREPLRRKVPRVGHLSQPVERCAHVDVVQLGEVVADGDEDILQVSGLLYSRSDELRVKRWAAATLATATPPAATAAATSPTSSAHPTSPPSSPSTVPPSDVAAHELAVLVAHEM